MDEMTQLMFIFSWTWFWMYSVRNVSGLVSSFRFQWWLTLAKEYHFYFNHKSLTTCTWTPALSCRKHPNIHLIQDDYKYNGYLKADGPLFVGFVFQTTCIILCLHFWQARKLRPFVKYNLIRYYTIIGLHYKMH